MPPPPPGGMPTKGDICDPSIKGGPRRCRRSRYHVRSRRSGRVAEGGALLRRYGDECLHRGFESLLLRDKNDPAAAGSFALQTERAGFEPATHLSARTRFPVALLRPLGHLSRWRPIVALCAGGKDRPEFPRSRALEAAAVARLAGRCHCVCPRAARAVCSISVAAERGIDAEGG